MHEISISGDFLGWISYLCRISSVLVISMTRFFSLTTVAVEVLLQMYLYVYSLTSAILHVLVAVFGY